MRTIPPSWLWQLNDAGSIVTTISGWMLASGLIRLVLDEEGVARGLFAGDKVSYMLARPDPPSTRIPAAAVWRTSARTS